MYEAATPLAALKLALDFSIPFDLVMTDFVMPEMNGLVMMERVHNIRPGLKYIVASGYSTDPALQHEVSHSSSTFIQKPYDFSKLKEHIARVIASNGEM